MDGDLNERELALAALDSLVSLCGHARFEDPETGAVFPFLKIHVHLWMRELARMVATLDPKPRLAYSDDLKEEEAKRAMPALHCRDCGAMGWGGTMRNFSRTPASLSERSTTISAFSG